MSIKHTDNVVKDSGFCTRLTGFNSVLTNNYLFCSSSSYIHHQADLKTFLYFVLLDLNFKSKK